MSSLRMVLTTITAGASLTSPAAMRSIISNPSARGIISSVISTS